MLASRGEPDYRVFVFANAGDDSEYPGTLAYFHQVAVPFAGANGLGLLEVRRTRRDGSAETLYGRLGWTWTPVGLAAGMTWTIPAATPTPTTGPA